MINTRFVDKYTVRELYNEKEMMVCVIPNKGNMSNSLKVIVG